MTGANERIPPYICKRITAGLLSLGFKDLYTVLIIVIVKQFVFDGVRNNFINCNYEQNKSKINEN